MALSRTVVARIAVAVVVAALVSAAGGAGATTRVHAPTAGGSLGTAAQADGADAALDSGASVWQGWELAFNGSRIVGDPGSASEAERTFQLRRVDEEGVVGELVREFTVDGDGTHRIDTRGLDGRFVIQYRGNPVYVQDGVGYLSDPPDGSAVTADTSAWTVRPQTLEAAWSEESAYNGQIVTLSLSSNRDSYVVAVSAPSLNFSDLTRLFDESDYARNYDARADQDVILLAADGDPFEVNVSGLAPGDHKLWIRVTDTTAAVRSTLTVNEPSGPQFGAIDRVTPAGDLLTVTANCAECYLIVGSQELNFLDVVALRDTDGDGTVAVRINTRYLGLNQGSPDVPQGAAFTAVDDEIEVYPPGRELASGYTLERVRLEVKPPITGDPPRPLGPGTYDLRLASSDAIGIPYNHISVEDLTDVTTVRLVEPGLGGIAPLAAPTGEPNALDVGTVASDPARDRIALGDRLIFRINVTGVYGYLAVEGEGIDALLDNADEGIDLTLFPANDPGTPIRIDRGNPRLVVDRAARRLYVVIDTRDLAMEAAFRPGRAYEATLTLRGVSGETYDVNEGAAHHDGYPYLDPGAEETATTRFTLVEPAATVDGPLRVPNERSVAITGTATVAPGTRLRISAVETDDAWKKTATTTVRDDGTWRVTLDFSNARPEQTFSLSVERGGNELASTEGTVVTPTPTPTGTSTPATATPESTATGTSATSTPAANATATPTSTPTPGAAEDTAPTPTPTPGGGSGLPMGLLLPIAGGVGFVLFLFVLVIGYRQLRG